MNIYGQNMAIQYVQKVSPTYMCIDNEEKKDILVSFHANDLELYRRD